MKKLLPLIGLVFLSCCQKEFSSGGGGTTPATDSFTVSVSNGYGAGKYITVDTVHIFSIAHSTNQLFNTWNSTDVSLLNEKDEWHTGLLCLQKM